MSLLPGGELFGSLMLLPFSSPGSAGPHGEEVSPAKSTATDDTGYGSPEHPVVAPPLTISITETTNVTPTCEPPAHHLTNAAYTGTADESASVPLRQTEASSQIRLGEAYQARVPPWNSGQLPPEPLRETRLWSPDERLETLEGGILSSWLGSFQRGNSQAHLYSFLCLHWIRPHTTCHHLGFSAYLEFARLLGARYRDAGNWCHQDVEV